MGSSDADKSSKEDKEGNEPRTPLSQDHTSAAFSAERSGFQVYSPLAPSGFTGSNPQAQSYVWGVQQFIPPYGTQPHPYVAMYPHGGIYAHPTMAPGSYPFIPFAIPHPNGITEASGYTNVNSESEANGKSPDVKAKLPIKRSNGSLGSLNMIIGKSSAPGKISGAAANGVNSESAGTGSESEGLSGASDTNCQNDSERNCDDQTDSDAPSKNGKIAQRLGNGGSPESDSVATHTMAIRSVPAAAVVGSVLCPATNLNIGMDYWGATPTTPNLAIHGKVVPSNPVQGVRSNTSSDDVKSQHWDERELRRQKRKQSNRESARRSRSRKQAEYDELAQGAEALEQENASLRAELDHIRSEYEHLLAQNASLEERLGEDPVQEDPTSSQDIQHLDSDVGEAEDQQSGR